MKQTIMFFCLILFISSCTKKKTPEQIQEIQTEIVTLESVQDIVLQKMIPDSIKTAQRDASYQLMYADYDSPSYWSLRGQINETQAVIDKCKEYVFIKRLIEEKELELSNN